MYAASIIQKNIKSFAASEGGWDLVYHSIEEIEEFKKWIDDNVSIDKNEKHSYYDWKGKIARSKQRQIRRWIQNEQLLCSFDSGYFESRYAYVCDEKGEIHKFKNRLAQEVFDQVIADFEEKNQSIELLILKARQLGMSTKTALKFIHRLLFRPHTQAVMSSVQAEKSELIGRILNICYEQCPWWLVPYRPTDRVGKMMGWDNGSILSIQSGSQPTGIAQGWTPTNIHISEIGDIPNPKKVLEEGLLRATHSSRNLFLVFEGTGNGNTGWLADKWRSAKEGWPQGRSRLFPMFISWPLAPELYPEADWLAKFPVPSGWQPIRETRTHVAKCEFYIRSTPYLSRVCGENWTMPRHQQWFWEFNYLEHVAVHAAKVWFSQMPADDLEALTGQNDRVFEPEVIELVSKERKQDYTAYAITGVSIDDGFEPRDADIDWDLPRITVEWESHRGQAFEWTMIPLLPVDDDTESNTFDKLLVWHDPQPGRDYSIGIDTADGLDKEEEDRTCINVTLNATGEEQDIQVAELVSRRINPAQTVGFAACIAAFYAQRNDGGRLRTRDPRGVKFCIEQRERPGDDCQFQLKLMGFNFQHVMTRYDGKVLRENMGHKEGFYTGPWSRPMLVNRFIDAIRNQWYKVNSKWLLKECENLERKVVAGKTRIEHQSGKKDDRVFSAALAYFTRHAFDVLAERSTKRYGGASANRPPEINEEMPSGSLVSVGD